MSSVSLSDVCEVSRGKVITEKQTTAGNIPVVAGGVRPTYFHSESNSGPDVITVSASGANAGHVAYWDRPIWASDCSTIVPRPNAGVDSRFIFRQLKALEPFIQDALRRGAAQPHVYAKDIAQLTVVVPEIDAQQRIAAVLDKADGLRVKRLEALAKVDALTRAIFIDAFVRGEDSFEARPIGDLVAPGKNMIRTGPFGSQLLHEEFTDEGIAVLGIDNAVQNRFAWGERRFITADKYEQLKRYTVRPGDVLITIMGTTGRVAVVPDDVPTAINTKHLCCVTLDQSRCLPEFLWAALRFHPAVLHDLGATHGAVMPGLNMGKIKASQVPVPPLELQEQFVDRKAAVERHESWSLRSANVLDVLFASLQQRAFRGEL